MPSNRPRVIGSVLLFHSATHRRQAGPGWKHGGASMPEPHSIGVGWVPETDAGKGAGVRPVPWCANSSHTQTVVLHRARRGSSGPCTNRAGMRPGSKSGRSLGLGRAGASAVTPLEPVRASRIRVPSRFESLYDFNFITQLIVIWKFVINDNQGLETHGPFRGGEYLGLNRAVALHRVSGPEGFGRADQDQTALVTALVVQAGGDLLPGVTALVERHRTQMLEAQCRGQERGGTGRQGRPAGADFGQPPSVHGRRVIGG